MRRRILQQLEKSDVGEPYATLYVHFRDRSTPVHRDCFQAALKKLKNKSYNESFLDLAYEVGYYDHAHLTNEIKKFTGLTPSQLRSYFGIN